MPTTKNEKLFLAYSIFFGVLAGYCIAITLQAIAIPYNAGFLLTTQEQQDLSILLAQASQAQTLIQIGLGGALIYLLLLLPILNPSINTGLFKQPKKLIKVVVYILVALVVTVGLSARLESFFGDMNGSLFIKIAGVSVPIIWWSILGEIGIAGDLTTWKPKHQPDIKTCILLAITTYFIFIILSLADNWAFLWFFTLVSELVCDQGEFSIQAYNWLKGGVIFLSTCTSVTLATAIIALAPRKRQLFERTEKLVLPVGLTIGFTLVLSGIYYYGAVQYDLNKPSLVDAIGSTNQPVATSHTAILQGNSIQSTPWRTAVDSFALTGTTTLAVSPENIRLLEEYQENRPRSIHHSAINDVLVKMEFNLWNSELATRRQQQTQNNVLQRQIFLNRISCLPITVENLTFLMDYGDESKWWVGNKAALRLASGAIHFNALEQAEIWLEMAKIGGASETALAALTIPAQPQLTDGKITGTIQTDRAVVVGLFRAGDIDQTIQLDTNFLTLNMVDSRHLAGNSEFTFTNIGNGRYFLAVKYEGEVAEISMAEQGVLILDTEQPQVDIGVVTIKPTP